MGLGDALEVVSEVAAPVAAIGDAVGAVGKVAGEAGAVANAVGGVAQAVSEAAPLSTVTESLGDIAANAGEGLPLLVPGAAEPNLPLIADGAPTAHDALIAFSQPGNPHNEVTSSSPPGMGNDVMNDVGGSTPTSEANRSEQDLQLEEDIQALTELAPPEVRSRAQEIDGLDLSHWNGRDSLGVAEVIRLWHEHNPDMANPIWNGSLQSFLDAHFEQDNRMMEANMRAMGMNPDGTKSASEGQLEEVKREAFLHVQMEQWRQNILHDHRFDNNEEARQDALARVNRIEATQLTQERMISMAKQLLLKTVTLVRGVAGIIGNKVGEQSSQGTQQTPSDSQ